MNEKGHVFTWGSGFKGKLGHGGPDNEFRPKKIQNLPEMTSVKAGGQFTVSLTQVKYTSEECENV